MSLQLYNLTLVRPTGIVSSIIGQFSGSKSQEIVVARGSWLELFRLDPHTAKLSSILSHNCFGILRSIASCRIAGSFKDYIIVGSDSGRIAILEYNVDKNMFVKIHLETFGKSGVRRIVPGQYLAVDPKGRACVIASVEKNKLVYVLNRDMQTNLTISSPLEAHTHNILVYHMVAVDVGYDNPVFASLEVDHGDIAYDEHNQPIATKRLTYYELDLGLNHVIKKWSTAVDRHCNILVQVPGGADGPSGVIVGTQNYIFYCHAHKPIQHRLLIPKRAGSFGPTTIVSAVMHKMRGEFFFLLQSDLGDLFKLTLDHNGDEVGSLTIKYFDTIPLCVSLNILKLGFLFAACESGDDVLYQFIKLGEGDEAEFQSGYYLKGEMADYDPVYFTPRPLENIRPVDTLGAQNPLLGSVVTNLTSDDTPQICTISGQGARSAFKALEYGMVVNEVVSSELPAVPLSVWTTKLTAADAVDKYIILSFSNETLVLSIGESVEEVTDSGFLASVPTIAVQQLGEDSLVQIHGNGIRHITASREINEWQTPDHTYITAASTNNYQVAIILSNHEVVYFEVDEDGQLSEYDEHKEIPGNPTCISIGDVPAGRVRSSFLAIGCTDSTCRIFSLELGNTLEPLSVQALTAPPSDIKILNMASGSGEAGTLYLHIGLETGVYILSVMDKITSQLSDTRTRFLGPKPVKLFSAKLGEEAQDVIITLCTKTWVGYVRGLAFDMAPLSYPTLNFVWSFSSEDIPRGAVAIESNNLRIFSLDRLGDKIKQDSVGLAHTPRRMTQNSFSTYFYVISSDNNTSRKEDPNEVSDDYKQFGYSRQKGLWASAIEIVDPVDLTIVSRIILEENEAAFSITSCKFDSRDKEYLVIGTAKDQIMIPKSCSGAFVCVYDYVDGGRNLELVHKTPMEEAPLAMIEFQGRLLVGVGRSVRLYDIGLKRLLRKAEVSIDFVTAITSLNTQGNRIVVGDIKNSLTYVVYKEKENALIPFADDVIARNITCCTMLDYDTCVAGDRFGNIFILRCPRKISEASDEDEYGIALTTQVSKMNGTGSKLELVSHFYCEDIPTSVVRTNLVVGGPQVIVYTGLQGTIAALIPFATKEDATFFQQLENLMRQMEPPLAGRDHVAYRGYYAPVKATIDGDLCERFELLPQEVQENIANELDRTVREVERKVADFRTRTVI